MMLEHAQQVWHQDSVDKLFLSLAIVMCPSDVHADLSTPSLYAFSICSCVHRVNET